MNESHFARVLPIVGRRLFDKRVAILGFPDAVPIVRYLAANGVGKWYWVTDDVTQVEILRADLAAQHGDALSLDITTTVHDSASPDIVVAIGTATWEEGVTLASAGGVPLVRVAFPNQIWIDTDVTQHFCISSISGNPQGDAAHTWDWRVNTPLMAHTIRAVLLGNPATIPSMWDDNDHAYFATPNTRRATILIAGLGSIGSIAAQHLAPYADSLVLADPDIVDTYNPVRQAFPLTTIGQSKAHALNAVIRNTEYGIRNIASIPHALTDEAEIADLIQQHSVAVGLIATGTAADFTIARVLRDHNIPHVVGRCYPRARYWEGIVIDYDTPAFEEMRGHLYVGPAAPPTPEQQRAYSDAGALEAEPATLIESGWAAAWLARLTWQLAQPVALREAWFLRHLAAQQTCFLGGLAVEDTPHGPAYGISKVGEVRPYGAAAIVK